MNDLAHPFVKRGIESLAHQASLAVKAGNMATFEWDLVSDTCYLDPLARVVFGVPHGKTTGAMVLEKIHPDDRETLDAAIERTLTEDVDYDTSFRVGTRDNFMWVGARGRVVERASDGAPLRMMGVNWDMTETKRSEERQKALTREMDHRVNNGYAIIKAIVSIGAQEFACAPAFEKMLSTQIHALASAHQLAASYLLHDSANTRAMSLTQVLRKTLRIVPKADLREELTTGLAILPQSVAPLCMLLHHICMTSRTDMPIHVVTLAQDDAMAKLTWISGVGEELAQSDPAEDFLFSLCVEQLNGKVLHFANAQDGQKVVISLPVLNAHCHVHDGKCEHGETCLLRDTCGYVRPGELKLD